MSENELFNELFNQDSGDDTSVKRSLIEEYHVEPNKTDVVTFLFPDHFRAGVHTYKYGPGSNRWPFRFYCKSKQGATCCSKLGAQEPLWWNIVLKYKLDSTGKPEVPIVGELLFLRFKHGKYISFRNGLLQARTDRFGTEEYDGLRINDIDFRIALDGDKQMQNFTINHSIYSTLVRVCSGEILKEVRDGKRKVDESTEKLINKFFNEREEYMKKKDGAAEKGEKFSLPQILIPELPRNLIDQSPTYQELLMEAKLIAQNVPKHAKFARNLTVEQINDIDKYASALGEDSAGGDTKPKKPEVSKVTASAEEVDKILGV